MVRLRRPELRPAPRLRAREGVGSLGRPHPRVPVPPGGADEVEIARDEEVRKEYDFDVYLAAIEWCQEEGIRTPADLAGRVVEPDTFEEVWIERCQRVGE